MTAELARRIDRLSTHAHAFHRWAHHPLCQPYRREVVLIGKRGRVCRGCLSLAMGLVIGTIAGLFVLTSLRLEIGSLGAAVALLLLSLKRRLHKIIGRTLPAAFASMAFFGAIRDTRAGNTLATLVVGVALLLGACGIVLYRKRGPDRSACEHCPERARLRPCSGIQPMIRRERAFQRLSQRWLDAVRK